MEDMPSYTRVDLHCHSRHSDGKLRPDELADCMAAGHVTVAALTDHDTLEGQVAFRLALNRHGIGWICGVEITSMHLGREVHLLAYGFDPASAELRGALASVRNRRQPASASVADELRVRGESAGDSLARDGVLDAKDAIDLVHRSGGKVFLAHPLVTEPDHSRLAALVQALKAAQLDGIEALYARHTAAQQEQLLALARDEGMLVSAGSDLHELGDRPGAAGVQMPTTLWKQFRDAVVHTAAPVREPVRTGSPRRRWGRFALHILLPSLLAVALFAVAIWWFVLPTFEKSLLDRKREMIRELTNSAWSILADAHRDEMDGRLSREEAQRAAAARIETLRYGREGKDYFWVQDSTPRMIMHPYRQELNQQDLSNVTDARGVRIFVEFADIVRRRGEGYAEYVWQWKDDPARLAPKESFIKGFEPWDWIIGTGIYTDDVHEEIARLERGLIYGSLAIVGIVAGLLLYVIRESMQLERDRSQAEDHLRASHHRYQSLVEASTEGALVVMQGRCQYANPVLLRLLGRTGHEIELLDLEDVLPHESVNQEAHGRLAIAAAGGEFAGGVEAKLKHASGSLLDCVLSASTIRLGDRDGIVLLVKQVDAGPRSHALMLPSEITVHLGDAQQIKASIGSAEDEQAVISCCHRVPDLAARWTSAGTHPRYIARMLTDVCDVASSRFIDLTQKRLGPAPAPFSFIALGSQGRQEQTLFTDQDNMIVLADDADEAATRPYFSALGARVCSLLNDAGYAYCRGQVMAQNEKWCRPLPYWKRNFAAWIARAEPQELLELCIFFDLRTVCGPAEYETSLRQSISAALADTPGFYPHFAQNSLLFKPPMRLFGHILETGEQPGHLDLKHAMMPIVNFARLYALRHSLPETGTLQRLAAMEQKELLAPSTRQDLSFAYEFLLRLRLEHQVRCMQSAQTVDNTITLKSLSHTEQVLLKEAFTQIDAVQKKISYEFLGGIS